MDGLRSEATEVVWPLPEGVLAPFDQEEVTISKREYVGLKARANYFEGLHTQALEKIRTLQGRIEKLKGQLRDVRQRFFGRRSEKSATPKESTPPSSSELTSPARALRGQRRGSRGHGRTSWAHLPVREEERDLGAAQKCCATCQEPLEAGPDRISEILELCTVFFRRRVRRKTYRRCECLPPEPDSDTPAAIVAPAVPGRLIRKSPFGVSIWVEVLLEKFHHGRPTNRLLQKWATFAVRVSPGTIAGGLKQLLPLTQPVMRAFKDQQLSEQLFHADETFWRVFEKIAQKAGYRWYLWTFLSPSVCFYILDPSRSAKVPLAHFAQLLQNAILMVDRYSAYKKLPRTLSIVCGRKSYYGSGAVWSAELAANLFTLFMTLVQCWKINPRRWLTEYLQACADNGGCAPADLSSFLPWQLSAERLHSLRTPLPVTHFNIPPNTS
jgi:transposase